jgi:hypothetical protein
LKPEESGIEIVRIFDKPKTSGDDEKNGRIAWDPREAFYETDYAGEYGRSFKLDKGQMGSGIVEVTAGGFIWRRCPNTQEVSKSSEVLLPLISAKSI